MKLRIVAAASGMVAILTGTVADAPFHRKLTRNEQILHALDRLTYGPRPGDVEAVERIGLRKWIDQQLHPERIPERAALQQKLAPLESLRMDTAELMERYPPPDLVRRIAEGKAPMPDEAMARAEIRNLIEKQERKAAKTGGDDAGTMDDGPRWEGPSVAVASMASGPGWQKNNSTKTAISL